jgi:hypothetical protein
MYATVKDTSCLIPIKWSPNLIGQAGQAPVKFDSLLFYEKFNGAGIAES